MLEKLATQKCQKEQTKKNLQEKPALFSQSRELPYSGQTQRNKLQPHPTSRGWVRSLGFHHQLAVIRCQIPTSSHTHWVVSEKTEMRVDPCPVVQVPPPTVVSVEAKRKAVPRCPALFTTRACQQRPSREPEIPLPSNNKPVPQPIAGWGMWTFTSTWPKPLLPLPLLKYKT